MRKGQLFTQMKFNRLFIEALAKVVIPVTTGIQRFCNTFKRLDSHFRGNDTLIILKTFARASIVLLIFVTSSGTLSLFASGNEALIKEAVAEEAGQGCGAIMFPINIVIAKNRSTYQSGDELSSVA